MKAGFNWQMDGWPKFTFDRAAVRDELDAFAKAFRAVKASLAMPPSPEDVARTLTAEAVTTSAIEGVDVDPAVVMSSICKALGVAAPPSGISSDARASKSLDWTSWAAFFIPVMTELLTDFLSALRFVAAKRDYLAKYESLFSERASKGILRMFEDGEKGARAGLTVPKWIRMTKVSKPTATRDLAELERIGAIVAHGDGNRIHYWLNHPLFEPEDPINDPITGGLEEYILGVVAACPGINRQSLALKAGRSVETVKRGIAALVAAGKVVHRGSRKTGGYFLR